MPPKRKTTTRSAQSTLSFAGKNSKVTKTSSPRNTKSSKKDPALLEDLTHSDGEVAEPTKAEKVIEEQAKDELEKDVKTEDVLGGRAETSYLGTDWVGDEQEQARKIPQTQINRYWREKERERKAPRVHQQDLSTHEKILREWDMSGQYGPCIGIARLKRWKRANVLGLNPPIEVLAVLLKEMEGGEAKSQRAHVDELMSSRFIET